VKRSGIVGFQRLQSPGNSDSRSVMKDPVTPDEFRAALGRFASGITVVTVETSEGHVHGMTASAFCSVSLRPPLVLVCVDHLAETYLHLNEHQQFGVSVLKEEQEALSEFFADPERNPDAAYRLGIQYGKMSGGTPVLDEALANLECYKVDSHPAGDHTIFVAEVRDSRLGDGIPLLYFRGRYGVFRE
jgi:flavin reductase (DIM6/NTAB) family NADH-FMN oxidoreductase RutF